MNAPEAPAKAAVIPNEIAETRRTFTPTSWAAARFCIVALIP